MKKVASLIMRLSFRSKWTKAEKIPLFSCASYIHLKTLEPRQLLELDRNYVSFTFPDEKIT